MRTASSRRTGTTKRVAWWCAGANMKPKPASSMHAATAAGARSMRAPSASSRSAEPERLVAERLPCLATAQPAPAAISAAVVETLKLLRPPPVPAVSSRSSRSVGTCAASARIVRASPASSSTVSPLVRSAIRNPAICVSETSPCMISASTSAVWSALRSFLDASASMAAGQDRVWHVLLGICRGRPETGVKRSCRRSCRRVATAETLRTHETAPHGCRPKRLSPFTKAV